VKPGEKNRGESGRKKKKEPVGARSKRGPGWSVRSKASKVQRTCYRANGLQKLGGGGRKKLEGVLSDS